MKPAIFVCQPIPDVALDRMRQVAEVEVFPFTHREISVGELESAARRSDYIFCMHSTPITASIVAANPDLKGFGVARARIDTQDVGACEAAGIPLLEARMLNLAYRVVEADRYCRGDRLPEPAETSQR